MVDFISVFCTVLPIVIVSLLLALTWSSFTGGGRAGIRPLARPSTKPRRLRRQHKLEDSKLCKTNTLVLPVSYSYYLRDQLQ